MTRVQNILILFLVLMTLALIPARSFAQVPTTLTAEFGPPAEANTWQKFTIPLTNEAFGVDAKTFQFVLANVQQFRIRTEMYTGADVGAIDSVKIGDRFLSTFNADNEGWNAAGDGTMEWIGDGGVTGGFLQISDWASGDWHWAVAPASWSGNWKDLIGTNIVFYLKTNQPSEASVVEISSVATQRLILSATPATIPAGGSGTLRINLSPAPSSNLTVNLISGETGCVTLPTEVNVPAGSSFIDVTMNAAPGAALCSSVITATATDYATSRITVNVGERNPADYGILHGRVTDATTGEGIAGASVSIDGLETVTDTDGSYRIENIYTGKIAANFYGTPRNGYAPLSVHFTDLSRAGYHLIQASVKGFYDYETFVIIPGGDTTKLDISLSPIIDTGSLRLVLNWGETPQDLDLYLDTPAIDGSEYIVAWFSPGSALTPPYAVLDHDDVDGLGPETITIRDLYDGTYKCFVHNFSEDPAITTSNGVVQIYGSEGLLHTVYVPKSGEGLFWYICDIDGATGEVTIKNTIVNEMPGASFITSALAKHKKPKTSRIEAFTELFDVTSWQWDFNNDGVIDATDENPVYTYNLPGTYTVSLTVSDGVDTYKETKENYITVLTIDTTPPGPVSDLFADIIGETSVQLTWTNPGDADYAGTIIMRRTDRFPASILDGLKMYDGIGRSYIDAGLSPGTTYYYTAFAYDNLRQVSEIGTTSRTSVTIKPPYRGGLLVNMSNIDARGFPLIKAFTSVVDSALLTPVTGLTKDNFTVAEDGHAESPITVEELTGSSDARADIAFVFDVTGSMGSQISALKQRALNFADALAEKGVDYRLALVTFGDEIREVHDFTSSAEEFKSWVENLVADGGGDTKENSLEGLARATTLSYRAVAQKMTILITDADYHEAGESGGGTTTYTTESMVE
ncbi:MAG: VWA domain-containing protein, partial [Calditrichaeota bacterium]|nr:VWA domain-containing protein [Calditrichota bacterium]